MNYRKVFVLVEGQTEETFIKQLLVPKFESSGIYLHPITIGGYVKYARFKA